MRSGARWTAGLVFIAATLCLAPSSYADVIWIPMPTKVDKFKEMMKEKGIDLYGGDDAIGFVEDHGTKMKIVTYRWMEIEELDLMKDAAVQAVRVQK